MVPPARLPPAGMSIKKINETHTLWPPGQWEGLAKFSISIFRFFPGPKTLEKIFKKRVFCGARAHGIHMMIILFPKGRL